MFAGGGVAMAICLLLMAGACGKSAQFPLHVWLPDAMEGPTPGERADPRRHDGHRRRVHGGPLHAAVLGLGRHCVVHHRWFAGRSTNGRGRHRRIHGALGGLIAMTQTDLKRVLAYSTISQLGYMFLGLGTGSLVGIAAGMFHLFTHAFFKALLFLGAGSVMHAMGGVIDMRRFGGLRRVMPITHWTFLVGCLALAGLFPFAGFWSKDAIFGAVHDRAHESVGLAHGWYSVLYWGAMMHRLADGVLHVPGILSHVLRPRAHPAGSGASCPRVAHCDDGAAC